MDPELTSSRLKPEVWGFAKAHHVVSLQLDFIVGIGAQAPQPVPRSALSLGLLIRAGIIHQIPLARDASYLAVFDLIHVNGFAIIGRHQPGELVLVAVQRHVVVFVVIRRCHDLRFVRHRSGGCDFLMRIAPVAQTDFVSQRESKFIVRIRLQTLDDIQRTWRRTG